MKVDVQRDNPPFKPVTITITIQTKEELDVIYDMSNYYIERNTNQIRNTPVAILKVRDMLYDMID